VGFQFFFLFNIQSLCVHMYAVFSILSFVLTGTQWPTLPKNGACTQDVLLAFAHGALVYSLIRRTFGESGVCTDVNSREETFERDLNPSQQIMSAIRSNHPAIPFPVISLWGQDGLEVRLRLEWCPCHWTTRVRARVYAITESTPSRSLRHHGVYAITESTPSRSLRLRHHGVYAITESTPSRGLRHHGVYAITESTPSRSLRHHSTPVQGDFVFLWS